MKGLKRLLLYLALIVLVVAVVAQFLPGKYHVERSVIIAARPEAIYPLLNQIKRWPEWSPWNQAKDPSISYTYEGPEEGVGAISKWDSKKWGDGKMKIIESAVTNGVKFDLSFVKGKYTSIGSVTFQPAGSDTKVTWAMDGEVSRNPVDRYLSLVMDKMVGGDFEEGLRTLKKRVEAK